MFERERVAEHVPVLSAWCASYLFLSRIVCRKKYACLPFGSTTFPFCDSTLEHLMYAIVETIFKNYYAQSQLESIRNKPDPMKFKICLFMWVQKKTYIFAQFERNAYKPFYRGTFSLTHDLSSLFPSLFTSFSIANSINCRISSNDSSFLCKTTASSEHTAWVHCKQLHYYCVKSLKWMIIWLVILLVQL